MTNEETVTIPKSRYESLLASEKFLLALETAGVDNWEYYYMAHRVYEGEDIDDIV
jgi:hypothetical protein